MKTTDTKEIKCPNCNEDLEQATCLGKDIPKPGDISICAYCGQLLMFTENLNQRKVEDSEFRTFDEEAQQQIAHVQMGIKQMIEKKD